MSERPLWTSAEILAAANGKASGDFAAHGVSIDSRAISTGDLFVAIKGPNFDGNDFAQAAIEAGASGAIVSRPMAARAPHILVANTLQALNDLAAAARSRTKARILAVTGSVGKTSTKEMLRHALGAYGSAFASGGNLNNQWGAPLSLARMPREAAFGVFELGMNHAGEISPLSRLVRPEVAIITWIAAAHLEFFASIEAIAEAKAEIFDGIKDGGTAVLPIDNEQYSLLAKRARERGANIATFGESPEAKCRLLSCAPGATGTAIEAEIAGRRVSYPLSFVGRHQAMNSLAALAGVASLGLSLEPAIAAMSALAPLAGRGKRESVRTAFGDIELVDESYNASPASMRAALDVLRALPVGEGGRKIAVLGDMRELGESALRLHRELANDVLNSGARLAFLVGPFMRELQDALPRSIATTHRADSEAMVAPLVSALRAGDIVLIKGSLGTRMKPLVDAVRQLGDARPARRVGNGS
jgi:UDP-N-acetylmuramoyl-tripeptide--D-alanyl-D-alanine ligase